MSSKNFILFSALLATLSHHAYCQSFPYSTYSGPAPIEPSPSASPPPMPSPAPVAAPEPSSNTCSQQHAVSYPPPLPIIVQDNDDSNTMHHMLYYLLFALRNRGNCGCNNGYGCNGGCGGSYNNGCGYSNNCGGSCNNGNNNCNCGGCDSSCDSGYDYSGISSCSGGSLGCGNVNYIPYPIPVPYNLPAGFQNCKESEETTNSCIGNNQKEIKLIIRADGNQCC